MNGFIGVGGAGDEGRVLQRAPAIDFGLQKGMSVVLRSS